MAANDPGRDLPPSQAEEARTTQLHQLQETLRNWGDYEPWWEATSREAQREAALWERLVGTHHNRAVNRPMLSILSKLSGDRSAGARRQGSQAKLSVAGGRHIRCADRVSVVRNPMAPNLLVLQWSCTACRRRRLHAWQGVGIGVIGARIIGLTASRQLGEIRGGNSERAQEGRRDRLPITTHCPKSVGTACKP